MFGNFSCREIFLVGKFFPWGKISCIPRAFCLVTPLSLSNKPAYYCHLNQVELSNSSVTCMRHRFPKRPTWMPSQATPTTRWREIYATWNETGSGIVNIEIIMQYYKTCVTSWATLVCSFSDHRLCSWCVIANIFKLVALWRTSVSSTYCFFKHLPQWIYDNYIRWINSEIFSIVCSIHKYFRMI